MTTTTLTWETATEWDSAASESGVVHESTANSDHNDATIVKQGYRLGTPYKSASALGIWPLHEDSGSTAYDFSGNNYDGTINGPMLGEGGLLGTSAMRFDATDDHINFGDIAAFEGINQITVSLWQNSVDNATSKKDFVSKASGSADDIWSLRYDPSNDNAIWYVDQGGDKSISGGTVNDGNWHHVVGVYDGNAGHMELFVDGTSIGTKSPTGSLVTSTAPVTIGSRGGDSAFAGGRICYAGVWNTAFTASEVQTLYDVVATSGSLITAEKLS